MIGDRVLINFQLYKLIRDDRRPSQKTKFFISRDALRDASRWLAIIADDILTALSYVGNVAKHTSATIADASRHMRTRLKNTLHSCISIICESAYFVFCFPSLRPIFAVRPSKVYFSGCQFQNRTYNKSLETYKSFEVDFAL